MDACERHATPPKALISDTRGIKVKDRLAAGNPACVLPVHNWHDPGAGRSTEPDCSNRIPQAAIVALDVEFPGLL